MDLMKRQFYHRIRGTFDEDGSELSLRERRIKENNMLEVVASISKEKRASSSVDVHSNAILVIDGSPEEIRVFGRPPSPLSDSTAAVGDDFDATLASLPKKNSKKWTLDPVADPPKSTSHRQKRTRSEVLLPSPPIPQTPGEDFQGIHSDVPSSSEPIVQPSGGSP